MDVDKITNSKETRFGEDLSIDLDNKDDDNGYFGTHTIDFQ